MAESEGFEPSEQCYPLTRLAIVRLQPLGQLSACSIKSGDPLPESPTAGLCAMFGGGGRIRTHGASFPAQRFSRPPP